MRTTICLVACIAGPLGLAFPAEGACTLEAAQSLIASGFTPEQIARICSALEPKQPAAAPAGPGDATAESRLSSGILEPDLGDDGIWKRFLSDGNYVLHNKGEVGSGFILLSSRPVAGWRTLSVMVRFTNEPVAQGLGGPALIYENGAAGGDLMIFTLQVDGSLAATRGTGRDFISVAARKDPTFAVSDWSFVELGLRRHDGEVELSVRGRPTGIAVPDSGGVGGSVGIATFGIGGFEFRDFAVDRDTPAPAEATTGQPGKGGS